MATKPAKRLLLIIRDGSTATLERAQDVARRWALSRENADEARFKKEVDAYALHDAAYESRAVSFPPMASPSAAQCYVIVIFDARESKLYWAPSEYTQQAYGVKAWYDLSPPAPVPVEEVTNVFNNYNYTVASSELAAALRITGMPVSGSLDVQVPTLDPPGGNDATAATAPEEKAPPLLITQRLPGERGWRMTVTPYVKESRFTAAPNTARKL